MAKTCPNNRQHRSEFAPDSMNVSLLALLLTAWPVYHWQNRPGATGGPISKVKSLWLVYAIVLWFVTPLFLWTQGWIFPALAISMILRGLVEIPLCCSGRWRVWMGIAHDAFHGALLVIGIVAFRHEPAIITWLGLMLIAIVTEMVFVRWFHHATGGPQTGTYFVPETSEFTHINRRTFWIALPQWLAFAVLCLLPS